MGQAKSIENTTGNLNDQSQTTPKHVLDDDRALLRLGKKPVLKGLKRNFGFFSILGFSCTVLVTWEGILTGGPAGVIWGFLIDWVGICSTYATIAELASMSVGNLNFWTKF
ncbi:MAG: hypothetical protein Q9191_000118 [Dirinaria sp. TL-2023a]